jgi:hypothetical protein
MSRTEHNQIFINALRALNLTSCQVISLSLESAPRNPFNFLDLPHVETERKYCFARLFDQLLAGGQLNWDNLRRSLADLGLELQAQELDRDIAAEDVAPLPSLRTIAIAYCGKFEPRFWHDFQRHLDCAHRSPTLFASRLIEIGASLQAIWADEWLNVCRRSLRAMKDVSILYLCTHGVAEKSQY